MNHSRGFVILDIVFFFFFLWLALYQGLTRVRYPINMVETVNDC